MALGEKIFELRKRCGLSQEQLGEKINVTRQTISNWELGETSPNPEQLKLISKELNVPIFPAATVFKEPISILGWKSRRPRAEFHILPPIYPSQFENPKDFADFVQKTVQAEIDRCNGTNRFYKGKMERIGGINAE